MFASASVYTTNYLFRSQIRFTAASNWLLKIWPRVFHTNKTTKMAKIKKQHKMIGGVVLAFVVFGVALGLLNKL